MNRASVHDAPDTASAADICRPLADALDCANLALNYYELAPGDDLGFCYHRHRAQEEVLVVLDGRLTFDTEAGDVTVEAKEAIRFAPGEWQQGRNDGPERAVVLAIGAPRTQGETDIRRHCRTCEKRTPAVPAREDDAVAFTCADCGTETGRYPA